MDKRHKEKCEQNRQLPVRMLEQKQRDEALGKSTLSEQNKGFNLMLKMGYKAGEALGKQSSNEKEKKLLEPIGIKLKTDREGLGKEHEKQQQMLEAERVRNELLKLRAESEESRAKMYLNKKKSEFTLRKSRHNLHKSQRVCFQLDSTRGGLMEPRVKWFWPVSVRRSLKRQKERRVHEQHEQLKSTKEKVGENEVSADLPITTTSTIHANQRMDYLEKIIDAQGISSTSNVKLIYEKRLSEFLQEDQVEQPTVEEEEQKEEEEVENGEDVETRGQLGTEQLRKEKQANEDEEMSEREDNDDNDDEEKDENEQDEQVILVKLPF